MARDPQDKSQRKKRLSRRDFVKTAGVGVGAAALGGLGADQAEAQGRPPHWDKQADIVVVGAGAAGLPAAIEATEQRRVRHLDRRQLRYWRPRHGERRQRRAWRRHEPAKEVRHRGFRGPSCSRISPTGRWSNPTASPTIDTTTRRSFARLPTIARQLSSGWSRMA